MEIREATLSDFDGISLLEGQVFKLHLDARPDMMKPRKRAFESEYFEKCLGDENIKIFVAEESGQIVGHCITRKWGYKDHPMIFDMTILDIDDLCVDERFRGKGVGKLLFERAVSYAKELSADHVELSVWGFNENAREFYEHLGMKVRISRMEYILT